MLSKSANRQYLNRDRCQSTYMRRAENTTGKSSDMVNGEVQQRLTCELSCANEKKQPIHYDEGFTPIFRQY